MGKYENGNKQIKTTNVIKLKNGFDLHRNVLEAISYGQKIAKKRFPLNCSLKTEKFKKGLQSQNEEAKEQGALEQSEADAISLELFLFMCQSELQSGDSFMWLFSLMQWSCIARSQNIDHLRFCHVSVKGGAMVIEFDVK